MVLCQELNAALEANSTWRMMDFSNRLSTVVFKQGMIYRGFSFIIFGRVSGVGRGSELMKVGCCRNLGPARHQVSEALLRTFLLLLYRDWLERLAGKGVDWVWIKHCWGAGRAR